MKKEKKPAKFYLRSILFKKILFVVFTLLSGTILAQTTFTGAVNNNWNNAGNWSAGVPAGATNVIIPSGKTCNMLSGDSYAGSGTIALGGTLSVPVGATLNPGGTLTMNTNNATLSAGGTVTLANVTVNTASTTDVVFLTNSATTPIIIKNGSTLSLNQGIFNVGTGNILTMGTNGSTTINSTGGGNFATTGVNGSDGGTILVDPSNGGSAAFNVNSTSANILQFYNLKFGTTVGSANNNWSVTNAGSVKINGTITVQDNNWNLGNGNPPIYGANSTLSIDNNNQGFTLPAGSNEAKLWTANSGTIGVTAGYPNNVIITNVGSSSGGYQNGNGWVPGAIALGINGTLTLGNGATNAQVDFSNVTSFTCGGFILNANSRFTAPKATMTVNGSWVDNQVVSGTTKGFFINGTSTINFGGTGTCASPNIIQAPAGNTETFYNLGFANGYTKLNSPVTVTNNLAFTGGIVSTSATNILTVTNTNPSAITGGGASTYIDGPVKWSMQAAAGTYNFPVGSNSVACANDYLPLTLNKVASSTATATVQAFTPGSGGTVDATMSSLSSTEYWSVSTSAGLPAGSIVSASRPTAIAPLAYIAESKTTSSGTYTSLAGTASAFGVSNSNDIGAGSTFFFTFGSPPIVSTLAATSITTTSVTLNGAFNTGSSKTTSFNYGLTTAYGTNVNSIHSPINSSTAKLDSQLVSGLTANTIYHYQATDVTDNGSDVVFITAPNPPVMGAPNSPTANGFTATWTAPAAMGAAPYTYTVEVSSDPTFATGVTQTGISSGATSYTFNTLASGTQYYYRVKAVNATASSAWSTTSAPVSTIIVPTVACTTGNGSPGTTGTISSAASAPTIDGNIDAVWSTVPSNTIAQKINVNDEGSGLQGAPNNTANWKTIWDTNYLYILVQIQDATLVSQGNLTGATNISTLNGGANLWDVDGIEFYLDGNNSKQGTCGGGSYDGQNDFQIRFNLGSPTVTGFTSVGSGNIASGINFNMSVVGGGYLLEARIPWTGAGGINSSAYPSIAAGNAIGIDFSINDNDGTAWRTAQTGWYDGASTGCAGSTEQYHIPNLFGTATLATCPQPPIVILPTVTNITATGATFGATVTSSGDSPLATRGTGFTASPTTTGTGNAVPEGGTAVSIYSGPARTGMSPQTKYYYLGYATNTNGGTGVSNVASFYTLSALPTVQPVLSANACTQMILNWTSITFPPIAQATQTGYLVLRATAPSLPSTTGIATRVATTQGALSAGTTLVTTIASGGTLTYTDASAVAGVTYNYILVPFTWDGVATDSTYNYFTTSPSAVSASISNLAAPGASATQQPTCAVATGTITISPWDNTLTYSVDGTNFFPGPTFTEAPNTYSVVAKNSSNCVSGSTQVTINPAPSGPTAPGVITVQPTCTVVTGTITISPWDNTLTYSINGTNFFAGPTFTVAPNTYSVVAKNSSNCVSIPTPVTINPATLAAPGVTIVQPTCTVGTGTITISPWDNTLTYSVDGTNFFAGPTFTEAPNTYSVVAKNGSNCVSSSTTVTINSSPSTPMIPSASVTQPNCKVPSGTITIAALSGLTYSIDGANYLASSNGAFAKLPIGTYLLTAQNSSGCISKADTVQIVAMSAPCPDFFIPNLITPNNDGKNDLFEITALPDGSSLTIVNRWGESVYQSSNYDNLWTGSNASDGVYYYSLQLPDGTEYKSWLNIMR
jgi:gliding motility-associated-like protein